MYVKVKYLTRLSTSST